jgi:hypothetical protein
LAKATPARPNWNAGNRPPLAAPWEKSTNMRNNAASLPLAERIKIRIRQVTHDRIRNLDVVEVHGQVIVRGQVASHHMRQLALQGALELLSGQDCQPQITVG